MSMETMARHLLPKGYPSTVAPSYTQYALWSAAGSAASSAAGVLSMQALLHAVGAGAGAIPIAAALQWVLKDGLGQLGGVLFTSFISTRFDSDAKRWRFVSALALEAATLLEVLTPAAPALFLPMAAAANVGKNVSWLSASATRAGIHQALAVSGNLADVTGKAGSQSIAASLVGTAAGIGLSTVVGSATPAVMAAWSALATVHLGSLYISLRGLSLPMLSSNRAEIVARAFCNSSKCSKSQLPSPDDTRQADQFIGPLGAHLISGQPAVSPITLLTNPELAQHPQMRQIFADALEQAIERWSTAKDLLEPQHHHHHDAADSDGSKTPAEDTAIPPTHPSTESTSLHPGATHQKQHFGFAVAAVPSHDEHGSHDVALWIESEASWSVQLAGHLAAVSLQLRLERNHTATPATQAMAGEATDEALAAFPAYISQLERAGWWVGHPMLEADKTQRIQIQ